MMFFRGIPNQSLWMWFIRWNNTPVINSQHRLIIVSYAPMAEWHRSVSEEVVYLFPFCFVLACIKLLPAWRHKSDNEWHTTTQASATMHHSYLFATVLRNLLLSLSRSLAVCVCFIAIARAMSCYPSQAFALCRNELSYPQTHIFLEHAVFPHSHFIVKRYENRTHQMKRTTNQVNVNFVRAAIN